MTAYAPTFLAGKKALLKSCIFGGLLGEKNTSSFFSLSLRKWVPLALGPTAEQKQTETEDSPPGPQPGEGATLFSPSPEEEQTPTSPGCPRQDRFVNFLDDLGPGWDAGGTALLREARHAGPGVDSAWGGAALEDAGGHPRRRAD